MNYPKRKPKDLKGKKKNKQSKWEIIKKMNKLNINIKAQKEST